MGPSALPVPVLDQVGLVADDGVDEAEAALEGEYDGGGGMQMLCVQLE